ncbi:unnamed protein product [Ceutorhynchus assimilis]|uniref:Schlafen group 3-like DNA/RNA helicase domain-containing protein n=1 Tax=Ceutorhynchus assimilis TaxID=467358 RepID=A0A9P0GN07_9CUCU|nr:unnamed protein product [Ceutorhynchus assimilis]
MALTPSDDRSEFDFENLKFYLPPSISGDVPYLKNMLFRYLEAEFPPKTNTVVYHVPKDFQRAGEKQGCQAEDLVFQRLKNLISLEIPNLWIMFFHSAAYGGYSNRNQRLGKLMIREHDFVVFIKYKDQHFVLLIEVKSTHDKATIKDNLEVTADSKVIKNNKRSAQHQLRDHLEILQNGLGYDVSPEIQTYIMWPFLGQFTKDPKQQIIKRWAEDKNLHVYENVLSDQKAFNIWFLQEVICQKVCSEKTFAHLLTRYIVLSCGIFMDEIDLDMLVLLTQQQLTVLSSTECKRGGSLVVHGIAGTGKTLLILKKLQLLYETGKLNAENRALYICYWPGIRCEVIQKIKTMGLESYVDTARFYITSTDFLKANKTKYKHIFMDEAEAIILSFQAEIVEKTFYRIYKSYHDGNCPRKNCSLASLEAFQQHSISKLLKLHIEEKIAWGELWFMVDTNQALMFLPKHSPNFLKKPHVILNKLIRSTSQICNFFSSVTKQNITEEEVNFPKAEKEPPIFWVPRTTNITDTVSQVIVDLCSTKGIKPSDICVMPFLQNELLTAEAINLQICQKFVDKAFQPVGIADVEDFLTNRTPNEFLIAWALRVKGLEFKVVIMVIDEDQFDNEDADDRRKIYVISSRCTCMLVVISDEYVRKATGLDKFSEDYCFNIKFEYNNN